MISPWRSDQYPRSTGRPLRQAGLSPRRTGFPGASIQTSRSFAPACPALSLSSAVSRRPVRVMLVPSGFPAVDCLVRVIELLSDLFEMGRGENRVHRLDDLGNGAEGNLQGFARVEALGSRCVVEVRDFVEQPGIAATPRIDSLLRVAYIKKRALAAVALDYLVDKVAQRFPLQAAGVLKFVEKPVIIRGVEPEIHFLASERLKRFCSPTGSAGCREQTGDIEKSKLSGIAHLSLVAR